MLSFVLTKDPNKLSEGRED